MIFEYDVHIAKKFGYNNMIMEIDYFNMVHHGKHYYP